MWQPSWAWENGSMQRRKDAKQEAETTHHSPTHRSLVTSRLLLPSDPLHRRVALLDHRTGRDIWACFGQHDVSTPAEAVQLAQTIRPRGLAPA